MRYVNYDPLNNMILGWYSLDVWKLENIPTPFVEVTDDEAIAAREIHANSVNPETKEFFVADFRTPEQLAALAAEEAAIARAAAMLTGADWNGTMVSLTADDGNGMLQAKTAFEMGVTETIIHFENGAKIPMVAADFAAFVAWFVTERNKFFI